MIKWLVFAVTFFVLMSSWIAPQAHAIDLFGADNCGTAEQCAIAKEKKLATGSNNIIWNVASNMLWLLGGVSTIMLIVGGVRFVFSSGDPSSAQAAKNTVLYAVVGLVVAIMAGAIVTLIARFFG